MERLSSLRFLFWRWRLAAFFLFFGPAEMGGRR